MRLLGVWTGTLPLVSQQPAPEQMCVCRYVCVCNYMYTLISYRYYVRSLFWRTRREIENEQINADCNLEVITILQRVGIDGKMWRTQYTFNPIPLMKDLLR